MILRGNFFSQELEMETGLTILAPDKLSGEPCKVVYLLHGICGRSGDWIDYTLLPNFSRDYRAIFVMPEVARSFYSDMKYGLNYFSYITEELPVMAGGLLNISQQRDDTAIIGASMGGYGALKAALAKPHRYGFCGAFASPCLMLKENLEYSQGAKRFKELFGERLFKDFQAVFGENIDWNPKEDVVELAKAISSNDIKPRLYLACGTSDPFFDDNKRFRDILHNLGYNSTFDEWPGNHNWDFFNEALRRSLQHLFNQ